MSSLQKELRRFLVAGFSAVGVDLTTYYILLHFLPHYGAKGISFLLGTCVAYLLNKYWTFEKHEKSYAEIVRFACLYTATLGANVLTNQVILELSNIVFLGFLGATAISTMLNFIGQKWWVFK